MKTFTYTGFEASGRRKKGLIEANDTKSAREKLAETGILVSRIAPAGSKATSSFLRGTRRFGTDDRIFFFRELSALLKAGMPLTSALDTLVEAPDAGGNRINMAALRDNVREGESFGDAMNKNLIGATEYETTVIEAAEKTGSLATALSGLATFLENRKAIHESVRSAMIYPTIVFAAAILIAIGLLGFAVPRITLMLTEQGGMPLPLLTRVMLKTGKIITATAIPLCVLFLTGALWVRREFARKSGHAEKISRRVFGFPLIGPAYSLLVSLRFARTLSLLLSGGTPLLEAMTLAGKASGNLWITRLAAIEADRVRHGERLSQAVRNIPPLAGLLPRWIEIGESSGALEKMLSDAADHLQKKWDVSIDRKMKLLEPLILMFVGVFVLLVTLSIILPITAINRMGI